MVAAWYTGINVTPSQHDTDKLFQLPAVTISRVWEAKVWLARNSWHYKETFNSTTQTVDIERWYRYTATYQMTVYARSTGELNWIVSDLNIRVLRPYTDSFATIGWVKQTSIPIKSFASPQDDVGTDTDLDIKFRYTRDVEQLEIPAMDKELRQYSISVTFWADYINQYNHDAIMKVWIITGI